LGGFSTQPGKWIQGHYKSFSPRGENCPEKSPNAKCQTHNY
jgi:hypothetical protein